MAGFPLRSVCVMVVVVLSVYYKIFLNMPTILLIPTQTILRHDRSANLLPTR